MELFWLIGSLILILVYLFDRKVLSFDYEYYSHYTKWILIASAIAIVVRYILGVFPPTPNLGFGTLLMVWWEDLVFSCLPIYYGKKYLHRYISTPLTIVASLAFAAGHLDQGLFWAFITLFYPLYISFHIGKRHGYGTAMALHVTYDILIYIVTITLGILK